MGVELEGLELLENHTGFFAIRGNEMIVKRAPISQIDSNGHATFTPGGIGLTTKGYNPGAIRVSDGSAGLKLNSYNYSGTVANSASMESAPEMDSHSDVQKFKTTQRKLEMTNKQIKNYDKLNKSIGGAQELIGLIDLASNIPNAVKSINDYVQATKDVGLVSDHAGNMGDAIKYVDSSGIKMDQQTRNDVVNYVVDGTLPDANAGLMPNSLIIQNGTQIMKANGIPIQPLNQQLKNKNIPQ